MSRRAPSTAAGLHQAQTQESQLQKVLLTHGQMAIPQAHVPATVAQAKLGTVLSNMAYYGYAPSLDAVRAMRDLDDAALAQFWAVTEPALKVLTGDDRPMAQFVVYKHFPAEVLSMSEAQYWLQQLFLYLGAPDDWFSADTPRAPLQERPSLKTLQCASRDALAQIFSSLMLAKARWTDNQREQAALLCSALQASVLALSDFGFKENGLWLMARAVKTGCHIAMADATDVLRLAAALSEGDISLREQVKFTRFSRAQRRTLVAALEQCKNLAADMALRPGPWKQLLSRLHPGDFAAPAVQAAYGQLYAGQLLSYNAQVEAMLRKRDPAVLGLLSSRPGEFARRLHSTYGLFGMPAVDAFCRIVDRLSTTQLLKLRRYVTTINARSSLLYPPRGNWTKAKLASNAKVELTATAEDALRAAFDRVLSVRMAQAFPEGVDLDLDCEQVKLQTNDQELAPYGRGTVFDIPQQMQYLRMASYWQHPAAGSTWFDNGVLFFDANWQPAGTVCWNVTHEVPGAVFSGDPVSSRDMKGRGCQMIDLQLDQLKRHGVRFAVWNILCFSRVPFSDADEVLATLQWGERAQEGKLYEPARAQMVFPLKGKNLSKYVAYIDVEQRKLVYMDANFKGDVQSASNNATSVSTLMPAFLEYLQAQPSVADLFVHARQGTTPVLLSDAQRDLAHNERAYVFKPVNPANTFRQVDLATLL